MFFFFFFFFLFSSVTLEETVTLQPPNLELDSLLSRFYGSVRTKKIYEWGV